MIKVRGFNRNKNNIGELFSLVIRNKYLMMSVEIVYNVKRQKTL